jgi:alpha-D-xyloside xylohydrolase
VFRNTGFHISGIKVSRSKNIQLSDKDYGGGSLYTGHPNELWSFGEDAFAIMKKQLELRNSLKPYIENLMKEAN